MIVLSLVLSAALAASLEARQEGDVLLITVKNDGKEPLLVVPGDDTVLVATRGNELSTESVLELEDLGPIARAPMPPRWQKPTGEAMHGAFVVLPKSTAEISLPAAKSELTVRTLAAASSRSLPWVISEQTVSRAKREDAPGERQFGKWVPHLRALVRYTQRVPPQSMVTRPEWDFAELAVSDAPPLPPPWPALVSEKAFAKAKMVTLVVKE